MKEVKPIENSVELLLFNNKETLFQDNKKYIELKEIQKTLKKDLLYLKEELDESYIVEDPETKMEQEIEKIYFEDISELNEEINSDQENESVVSESF
jgi:hypothetical protein